MGQKHHDDPSPPSTGPGPGGQHGLGHRLVFAWESLSGCFRTLMGVSEGTGLGRMVSLGNTGLQSKQGSCL